MTPAAAQAAPASRPHCDHSTISATLTGKWGVSSLPKTAPVMISLFSGFMAFLLF